MSVVRRSGPDRVRLSAVFAIREFRGLWAAEVLSTAGDQLARVALAVLIYSRTGSAALTGLTYALTFVPSFLGGSLLGGLGDRYSRRTILVTTDLARAVLIGLAALAARPGVPLWSLCTLVAGVALLAGPFKAAQQALLPDVVPDDLYVSAMAVRSIAVQTAQLAGFAGGGLAIALLGARGSLALDAASFVVSAILVSVFVRRRAPQVSERTSLRSSVVDGVRLLSRDPALRALIGLCWLAGFYVVPEALAAPYASSLGGGAGTVGAIMASDPLGSVLGGFVFAKFVGEVTRQRVMGVLGIAAGLPLAACAVHPGIWVSMAMFALSGAAASAYTLQGVATFMRRLPPDQRSQGSGLLSSGLYTVQGLGALAGGILADAVGPAHAVAIAGLAGMGAAVPIALAWSRAEYADGSVDSDLAVAHVRLPSGPPASTG